MSGPLSGWVGESWDRLGGGEEKGGGGRDNERFRVGIGFGQIGVEWSEQVEWSGAEG